MLCAKCNYDNPADALFCMKCGSKVEESLFFLQHRKSR